MRLAASLLRFWWFRGYLIEGRTRLESLLDLRPAVPFGDEVWAKALHALGIHRFSDDTLGDWSMLRVRVWTRAWKYTGGWKTSHVRPPSFGISGVYAPSSAVDGARIFPG